MSLSDHPAYQLVLVHARLLGCGIARKVADDLKAMNETLLSGDDSGLTSVWQEICAQIQGEESNFWDEYKAVAQDLIGARLEKHSREEQEMLWLSTEPGWDWLWDVVNAGDEAPPAHPGVDQQSVVDWIFGKFLWRLAESEEDPNVTRFLDREFGEDYDEDDDEEGDDLGR